MTNKARTVKNVGTIQSFVKTPIVIDTTIPILAATIELSETIRLRRSVVKKETSRKMKRIGLVTSNIPPDVATAFPPLNFAKIG